MPTSQQPLPSHQPDPVRFLLRRLDRPHPTRRQIDGAWWPYGDRLDEEVAVMIEAARVVGFDARHVTFCPSAWSVATKKVTVGGVKVRLGGSDSQVPHTVSLIDPSGLGRLEIMIVAPGTPSDVARYAMALAAEGQGDEPGVEVMTRARQAVHGRR